MTGAGFAPAGVFLAGIGYQEAPARDRSQALTDDYGRRHGARYIDPFTKRYAIDANGRYKGMPNVAQLVELAFLTEAGSSAVPGMGLTPAGGVVSNGFVAERKEAVRKALLSLTQSGLVELVSVDVDISRRPTMTLVRWRDLTTSQDQESRL